MVTGITAWPNPFKSFITVNINASQHTEMMIRLMDASGRTVKIDRQQFSRGISQVTINGLDRLTHGVYLLAVTDKNSGNTTTFKFIKEY
jgi:hypothetical protein